MADPAERFFFCWPLSGTAKATLTVRGRFDGEDVELLIENFTVALRALRKAAPPPESPLGTTEEG